MLRATLFRDRAVRSAPSSMNEAVHDVYEHGAGSDRAAFKEEREEKARRFRLKYQTQDDKKRNERSNVVPFIGVFDSVAALGAAGVKKIAIIGVAIIVGLALEASIAGALHWLLGWSFWSTFLILSWCWALFALVYSTWLRIRSIENFIQKGPSWKFGNRRFHLNRVEIEFL